MTEPGTNETRKRARRGSKTVFRRKRRNGTYYDGWWIRTTDAFGERRLEWGGETKEAALALLGKRRSERFEGRRTGARRVDSVSLKGLESRLLDHWRATLTPTTVSGRTGILDAAKTYFGDRPMKSITRADLGRFLTTLRLQKNRKPATIRHYAAVLSSAWEYAVEIGAAAANPCRGLKLPRADQRPVPYITDEQRRSLYAHTPIRYRAAVMLLGDAGLRRGEVMDLDWNHVGPEFANVTVARSKNHKPRIVPTTPRLAAALREHFDSRASAPMDGPPVLFDFPARELNDAVTKAAKAAGLPGFTPHKLRHAFASWLMQRGVAITDVQRLLGHADIQMTARYAQWAPADAGVRAIAALDAKDTQSHSPSRSLEIGG